jgi:hypothetical protein
MEDRKHRLRGRAPEESAESTNRRRMSRIVHDHKGTATVEWHDAPAGYERPVLEIEGGSVPAALNADSLSLESEDTFNPYTRVPESGRKRTPGQRTDLRKLSAWIKMMRSLEEAKKRGGDDE